MKEEELLADILAAPDDDAPRLVYADFLQERGGKNDALRGERIVVQCERERLEREDKTTTLEYRRARWREEELQLPLAGTMRRGFRNQYILAASSTARALRSLAADPAHPFLERIVVGAIELDAPAALALAPRLPDDEPLCAVTHGLPPAELLPAVVGVRYSGPGERAIRDLIELSAPNLRSVTVTAGLRYCRDAFLQFADMPAFAALDHVEVWRLEDEELAALVPRVRTQAHLTLVVSHDPDLRPFRGGHVLPHVRKLNVTATYDRDHIDAIAKDAVHLERWTAAHGIASEACEALVASAITRRLRHLEIRTFPRDSDVVRLITAPWERLTSLAIGRAKIGRELVNAPALESLVTLRLFGCEIAADVQAAIRARWPRARIE